MLSLNEYNRFFGNNSTGRKIKTENGQRSSPRHITALETYD